MKTSPFRIVALLAFATVFLAPDARGSGANNFANRTLLSGAYVVDTLTEMINFTREFGEPVHTAKGIGKTAWWRWVAPNNGYCTIQTLRTASLVDTTVTVYTGNAFGNLNRVAAGDDVVGDTTSSVTFFATAGSAYSIVVEAGALGIGNVEDVLLGLRHTGTGSASFFGSWQSPAQEYAASANGLVSFKLTSGGLATGLLTAGGTRYPFKTQATADSYLVVSFARKSAEGKILSPLTLRVDLTKLDATTVIAPVEVSDGAVIHGTCFLLRTGTFSADKLSALAGRYTVGLAFPTVSGAGFALAKVSSKGNVSIAGIAGDGQKFTCASTLGTLAVAPSYVGIHIHQSFFAGEGWLNGYMSLNPGAPNRIQTGDGLRYRRPARPGAYFPNGFSVTVSVEGASYKFPTPGGRALGFLNAANGAGKLAITDAPGELGALMENLTLTKSNTFVFANATRRPMLKLSAATGLVSGTITEAAGPTRKLSGVLHDDAGSVRVRGFVSGISRTAAFTVGP